MRSFSRPVLLCSSLLILASNVESDVFTPTENQVKAAYLYNFTKFVEWPETSFTDNTFSICVYGNNPVVKEISSELAGKSSLDKNLSIRRVLNVEAARSCQMLYIAKAEKDDVDDAVKGLEQLPVLTVSDIRGFVSREGMIEFIPEEGRLRFGVNIAAAQRAHLKVSSQLIKVAKSVREQL